MLIGDLATAIFRNGEGKIVAQLYILPDGSLHDDSWLCPKGWD